MYSGLSVARDQPDGGPRRTRAIPPACHENAPGSARVDGPSFIFCFVFVEQRLRECSDRSPQTPPSAVGEISGFPERGEIYISSARADAPKRDEPCELR